VDKKVYQGIIDRLEESSGGENSAGFYLTLTKVKAWIEARMKPMNAYFKEEMGKLGVASFMEDGVVLTLGEQDKSTLNQEKMVKLLTEKGFRGYAVRTIDVVDDEKLSELVYAGHITPQEVADCTDKKIVKVLKASEVKM
jgi:hypothetical protein